jgi:hypothetical protein
MVPNIIHEYDLSIIFTLLIVFSSSVFHYWCYNYRLRMDECAVTHYIFRVMYEK